MEFSLDDRSPRPETYTDNLDAQQPPLTKYISYNDFSLNLESVFHKWKVSIVPELHVSFFVIIPLLYYKLEIFINNLHIFMHEIGDWGKHMHAQK